MRAVQIPRTKTKDAMTISNAAGNAAVLIDTTRVQTDHQLQAVAGWDPYAVWRTRVLVPRLAEQAFATSSEPAAAKPRLVRSA
jgi:hypothetical protein